MNVLGNKILMGLPKGRILPKSIAFLRRAGITVAGDIEANRKLVQPTSQENLVVSVMRNSDTPVYNELGACDVAIIGLDSIVETATSSGFYDILDLGIASCRLMTAARRGYVRTGRTIRVATKFAYTARRHYANMGVQAEVVKLNGTVELSVALGLADEIVDLVETGKTLADNNLLPLETVLEVTSHLVVNCNSMVTKHRAILNLIEQLEQVCDTKSNRTFFAVQVK